MALNFLFQQVQNAVSQNAGAQQQTGFNPTNLMSDIEGLFTQHAQATGQQIMPASQDPYGDPGAGGILPASQDPYGDPGR